MTTKRSRLRLKIIQELFEVGQTKASQYLSDMKKKVNRDDGIVFVYEFLEAYNLSEDILKKLA
jgi:predicted transcriptional regulator with HTH domain